jgi:glycosyltransferase involved in cell wall biosynthesis
LFKGIDNTFLSDVVNTSDIHLLEIDEKEKERKIYELLKKHKKLDNTEKDEERLKRLKIRTYIISLQKRIMELADENIFVSNFLKNSAKEMYGMEGITIPNGTNMNEVYEKNKKFIEESAKKWRRKYHSKTDILIGYVGRVEESKGVLELLEAFKKLSRIKFISIFLVHIQNIF